ncbi:MAG: M28 family peptidase [Bacteroidia bacterium]
MGQAGIWLKRVAGLFAFCALFTACSEHPTNKVQDNNSQPPAQPRKIVKAPVFSADSAYAFTRQQVSFGPRTMNSKAHEKCAQYFISKLKSYKLSVTIQEGTVKNYDGKLFQFKNITGSYHPERKSRIAVFCHWDSRSIADQDTLRVNEPIDGADDGASGCAMMLEIGRDLLTQETSIGVDLIFLDAEDTGQPENAPQEKKATNDWCLGSQYWSTHIPEGYAPRFGILLDMVGAKNASFPMEGVSMEFAPEVVQKIWGIANDIGYSNYFLYSQDGGITDDHAFINRNAKIPTVDIINYNSEQGGFGFYHHRHSDNMDIIDKKTLQAVGQTVVQVIYSEVQ